MESFRQLYSGLNQHKPNRSGSIIIRYYKVQDTLFVRKTRQL